MQYASRRYFAGRRSKEHVLRHLAPGNYMVIGIETSPVGGKTGKVSGNWCKA
jgi:hypothetical protein